ncbi:hypothetical protein CBR_g8948 [Chara braunii]|uniref:phosphoribosylaminoimidazole carboxylase n=1 Tax=Chara braunii TaxID=69332 RepID=A0A388KN92_CHABU|nr:hypothetical protein CBR_g8948 [Chara braunii]|eukprot:GBG71530.1 hypothetical protein CBR_g8948 [Chara braunii]
MKVGIWSRIRRMREGRYLVGRDDDAATERKEKESRRRMNEACEAAMSVSESILLLQGSQSAVAARGPLSGLVAEERHVASGVCFVNERLGSRSRRRRRLLVGDDGRVGGGCKIPVKESRVDVNQNQNQNHWQQVRRKNNVNGSALLIGWKKLPDGLTALTRHACMGDVETNHHHHHHHHQDHQVATRAVAGHSSSILDTVGCSADLCSSDMGVCDSVVGVLGGGQLGRMLLQAASPLAIRVAVLDPAPDAPASGLAYRHVVGSFRDTEAVRQFASGCNVLTVEIEHVDVDSLDALAAEGVDVEPKPSTIRTIQDKYLQKVHFSKHGVPLPEFLRLTDRASAVEAGQQFGYPLMIKTRRLAYDGRGNAVARTEKDLDSAISSLGGYERGLYAEKWAPFEKELAVMVARGRDGTLRSYPVVETTHKDNICHTVLAPAPVPAQVAEAAMSVAEKAIGSLEGAGVFGVELFLLPGGEVLLNEVAPRPHNSGHYTIEGCITSQFEQHLRAVLGLPLGDTSMRLPCAMMLNILGEDEGEAGFHIAHELMARALEIPGASIHWYGKQEIRKQRKMGHITVVGPSLEVVRNRMAKIRGESDSEHPIDRFNTLARARTDEMVSTDANSGDVAAPVGIIMGSDSDLPVMKAAAEVLDEFGMVAAMTPLPVIGVPVRGSSLDGLDSLLSIVQMPRGVPVATVAINNAANAGLLALRIIGTSDPATLERMESYQKMMEDTVMEKAEWLETVGWKDYLGLSSPGGGKV